jgi:type IV pilus assembly protein PilO
MSVKVPMNPEVVSMLRQRKVVLPALIGLVVLFIWLVALFNPEGHKLSSVNTKVQAAQSEQTVLQARLARLREYSRESSQLQALGQRLDAAVPATTDVYDYITAISDAASSTGMKVASVTPTGATLSGNVAVIPVTVSANGTYGQTLAFVKALYALPRLTVITQMSMTGGGQNTNRNTVLSDQFNLDILAQPSAASKTASG